MISRLFSFCYFLIRFSGLADFFRHCFSRNNVSIVMYHNPKPEVFEKHLKYINRKYNLISLSTFSEAFKSGNLQNIPKYALIVTFDDGWKENYHLLPLISQYKFRPTIFLTSHIIDTERCFWWTKCKAEEIEHLKKLPNRERLKHLKEKYRFHFKKNYSGERQALNLAEINKMKAHIDFGLHTCYHPILTQCTFQEKRAEIIECKNEIERKIGTQPEFFAFPNGDYDAECIEILQECGVTFARTTEVGWNNHKSHPHKLKIRAISDNGSVTKLAAELTGIPLFIQSLLFKNRFPKLEVLKSTVDIIRKYFIELFEINTRKVS